MIGFEAPTFLLGIGVLLVVMGRELLRQRRGPRGLDRRYVSALLLRTAAVSLIVGALAKPYLEEERTTSNAMLLLDVSESMDEDAAQSLLSEATRIRPDTAELEVVPFAKDTALSSVFSPGTFRSIKNAWFRLDVGGSNLERALQQTLTREPASVLVVSDGFETAGSALSLVDTLKSRGFKVFPFTPRTNARRTDFRISNLYAPLVAPTQKSVDIRTSIENGTDRPQRGTLTVTHDGKTVLDRQVSVEPGEELLFVAPSDPSKEGIKEIVATLTPGDRDAAPSSHTIYLSGRSREKVLLINGAAEDGRFLSAILGEQSFQLTNITAGDSLGTLPTLADFSTVIFNNVARAQLPSNAVDEIDRFVKRGGGFLMIGGNRSFGLGGYLRTPMETILPVEIVPPQTVKKRLNVAVALVLDKSRSMAFGERIEFAKEAARETIRNLKDDDYVTVIGFDSAPFVVVKIGQLRDTRAEALERVGRLFPANKTNMLPAIDEARRALSRVEAGRKHMIILTDGRIPDEGPYYAEIVRQMRLLGITVSTVLVGGETDTGMLNQMAELGGGGYYQAADPRSLPRIFLSDIKVSTGERSLKEATEFAVRSAPGRKSTPITAFPPIRGYVETRPKEGAALELVAFTDEKAEPLLATGRHGQGRTAAFTSDVSGRWSNYWLEWGKFRAFWSDVLAAVRPSGGATDDVVFDLRHFYEHGLLQLDLSIFDESATGGLSAVIALPDGTNRSIEFSSPSRGRFMSQIGNVTAGKYEVRAKLGDRALTPVAFYLSGELFGEQKGRGFNTPLLSALASGTGGTLNPRAVDIAAQTYRQTERYQLGTACLFLAALLLTLAILWREVICRGGRFNMRAGLKKFQRLKRAA